MISVGKGDSIIQASPASLRFWEKLGLTPRGGKKDLTAFLFFEENGPDKQLLAETWLRKLSTTYSVCPLIDSFQLLLNLFLGTSIGYPHSWKPFPLFRGRHICLATGFPSQTPKYLIPSSFKCVADRRITSFIRHGLAS